jgi:hypothetical protein
MSSVVGTVKNGVLIGLLQHPSVVQQLQQLPPDQVISVVILMIITAKVGQTGLERFAQIVMQDSLWRGLVNLVVVTFEPVISLLQLMIGTLLVRAILYYSSQTFVGSVLTFAIGVVVDAIMNYRPPAV